MPKHTERFDPTEIPGLLEKAKAGDIVARNELLHRFQRLVATLVNVCITGRPYTSYQFSFLRMFTGRDVVAAAAMLRRELTAYQKDELFSTGQLAVMQAIDKCETNLASTIVICFKDLIYSMIKDPNNRPGVDIDYETPDETDLWGETDFNLFLSSLTEEEWIVAQQIIEGDKPINIPIGLKEKLENYLSEEINDTSGY